MRTQPRENASSTQYFDLGFVSPVLTGKTKQDTRKTRRTRISRRERTYAYVTKGKRKFDAVFRRRFFVLRLPYDGAVR